MHRPQSDSADLTPAGSDTLDIGQPVLASYEIGRRRFPVSALGPIAKALKVPVEHLLGEEPATRQVGQLLPTVLGRTLTKRLGINPRDYLADVLPRLASGTTSDVPSLTPAAWLRAR
ncbi:MAG: hypothetical protein ACKV19_26305 [Verrucomicrobiales bacterium]